MQGHRVPYPEPHRPCQAHPYVLISPGWNKSNTKQNTEDRLSPLQLPERGCIFFIIIDAIIDTGKSPGMENSGWEKSGRGKFRLGKVRAGKIPAGKIPGGENSGWEKSGLGKVRAGKIPAGKSPGGENSVCGSLDGAPGAERNTISRPRLRTLTPQTPPPPHAPVTSPPPQAPEENAHSGTRRRQILQYLPQGQ